MKLFLLFHLTAVDTLMIVSLFFEVFLLLYFWKMQWILRIGTENGPVNFLGTSFAVFLFCHNLVFFFYQHCLHLVPVPSDSHHSELSCSSDCVCPAIPSCLLEVLPLLYMQGTEVQGKLDVLPTSGIQAKAQTEGESLRSSSALHSQKWIIPCCFTGKKFRWQFFCFEQVIFSYAT